MGDVRRAVELLVGVQRRRGRDWAAERARDGPVVPLPPLGSRVPSKWLAVDLETGHVWEVRGGESPTWREVIDEES